MTGVTPAIAAAKEAQKIMKDPNPFPVGREFRVLGHIPRWSIIRTIRQQNVAEHTTMVMFLVDRLCDYILSTVGIGPFVSAIITRGEILRMALYHDLSEILSGDIANPAKQAMFRQPSAKSEYKDWEAERLWERFPWYAEPTNQFARDVIGICDLLEADIFLLEENKMGNQEVNAIGTDIGCCMRLLAEKFQGKYNVDVMPFIMAAKAEIVNRSDRVVK